MVLKENMQRGVFSAPEQVCVKYTSTQELSKSDVLSTMKLIKMELQDLIVWGFVLFCFVLFCFVLFCF